MSSSVLTECDHIAVVDSELTAEAFGISLRWMGAGCGNGIVGGATCFG